MKIDQVLSKCDGWCDAFKAIKCKISYNQYWILMKMFSTSSTTIVDVLCFHVKYAKVSLPRDFLRYVAVVVIFVYHFFSVFWWILILGLLRISISNNINNSFIHTCRIWFYPALAARASRVSLSRFIPETVDRRKCLKSFLFNFLLSFCPMGYNINFSFLVIKSKIIQ